MSAFILPAEAHRMADVINTHVVADRSNVGRWVAIRLSDGGSDGVVYDTRADAVRHQLHESLCAYVVIHPGGMSAKECDSVLRFYRFAYAAGRRVTDPEQPDYILPSTTNDFSSQLRRLARSSK